MYGTFGLALTRLFHWSHHRAAWISLGIDSSTWLGAASARLPAGTVVGLQVGTTF
jgi:hypothetical protein